MRRGATSSGLSAALAIGVTALALGSAGVVSAGGQPAAANQHNPVPSLPGAVTEPPEWLQEGPPPPFDVEAFFDAPPPHRNAAPLYLDTFFEFATDLEICFPEGEERDRRRQLAADRSEVFFAVSQALAYDPKSVSDVEIDAILAVHQIGFEKLAEAQQRERCVFQTGLSLDALLPHAQAARQVVRVADLRVRRTVEQGDLDAATGDVAMTLRLARDLQPRGSMISQLVAAALVQVISQNLIGTILASPELRVEHCDRLLTILAEHEEKAIDGSVEGLRAEYLFGRSVLWDLVHEQDKVRDDLESHGIEVGDSVVQSALDPTISLLDPSVGGARPDGADDSPEDLDAQVAQTTPEEMARAVAMLNEYYRALFDLSEVPYAERLVRIGDLEPEAGDGGVLVEIATDLQPAVEAFTRAMGRMQATLRATTCLVAVRRWQLSHDDSPADLAAVVHDAGLPEVPTDPYDGQPMRMAIVDGEPVIYSVGRDGKDDGGLKDSQYDTQPGDLIYRLPREQSDE